VGAANGGALGGGNRERSCSFPKLLSVCVQSVTDKVLSHPPQTLPVLGFPPPPAVKLILLWASIVTRFPHVLVKVDKSHHCRTGNC